MSDESKCPVTGKSSQQVAGGGPSNRDWWPNRLNLNILRQHSNLSNPMGEDFNYTEAFKSCLLYTSPSPRDRTRSRMPSSA